MTRPSDDALWACVAETLRTVIVPALADDGHARGAAVALVGLAEYARARPDDPGAARTARLDAALGALAGNSLLPAVGTVVERVAVALTAAVGRDDADAVAVRTTLRTLLVEHLDADLAATDGLEEALRGRLPDE